MTLIHSTTMPGGERLIVILPLSVTSQDHQAARLQADDVIDRVMTQQIDCIVRWVDGSLADRLDSEASR